MSNKQMVNKQKVVLEKGIISSLEQRIKILERYAKYKEEVDKINDATISFMSQPLVGKEIDSNGFTKDSGIVELLDGNAEHFLKTLQNPNTFRFEDIIQFNSNMKCYYMICVEFDVNKHFGVIEEEVEDFSWCLED